MTITVVQTAHPIFGGNTQSFSSTPTVGNSIIVVALNNGGGHLASITDNQTGGGNAYTIVVNEPDSLGSGSSSASFAAIGWSQGITKSSGTFTVTIQDAFSLSPVPFIMEVSGLSGGVDKSGGANDGGSTPTSLTVTCSGVNSIASDLAVYGICIQGGNAAYFSAGATSGWTSPLVDIPANQGVSVCAGYKILSAVETTQAVSQTWTTGARCAGAIATFSSPPPPLGGGIFVTA